MSPLSRTRIHLCLPSYVREGSKRDESKRKRKRICRSFSFFLGACATSYDIVFDMAWHGVVSHCKVWMCIFWRLDLLEGCSFLVESKIREDDERV